MLVYKIKDVLFKSTCWLEYFHMGTRMENSTTLLLEGEKKDRWNLLVDELRVV